MFKSVPASFKNSFLLYVGVLNISGFFFLKLITTSPIVLLYWFTISDIILPSRSFETPKSPDSNACLILLATSVLPWASISLIRSSKFFVLLAFCSLSLASWSPRLFTVSFLAFEESTGSLLVTSVNDFSALSSINLTIAGITFASLSEKPLSISNISLPVLASTSKFSKPDFLSAGISLESPLPSLSLNSIFFCFISWLNTVKFSSYQSSFGWEVSYLSFNSWSSNLLWEGVSSFIIPSITSIPLWVTLLLASFKEPFKTKCISSCIKSPILFCSKAFCLFTTLLLLTLSKNPTLLVTSSRFFGKVSLYIFWNSCGVSTLKGNSWPSCLALSLASTKPCS